MHISLVCAPWLLLHCQGTVSSQCLTSGRQTIMQRQLCSKQLASESRDTWHHDPHHIVHGNLFWE